MIFDKLKGAMIHSHQAQIKEYPAKESFPLVGKPGYYYRATDTNKLYNYTDKYNELGQLFTPKQQTFILSETDLVNKYVTVTEPITDNQSVMVFISNVGLIAEVGIDYSLSGQEIFWQTYAFESLLSIGDKLRVVYN